MLRVQLALWEVQVVLQVQQVQQGQAQRVQLAQQAHKELLVQKGRKVIKATPAVLQELRVLLVLPVLQEVQVLLALQDP